MDISAGQSNNYTNLSLEQQKSLIFSFKEANPSGIPQKNQYTNVLLIDNTTPSYQTFVDSANSTTFPIVYSKDCSGTELIAVLRDRFTSIPRIGFVFASNSNNAVTFLDDELLFTNNETNKPYSKNVELVLTMIREFSVVNIDFLACDTLNYSNWKNYYDLLTQSTEVIVGASDNKTGNIKYGGDWILESTSQDIELVYFTKSIEYYKYLLDTPFATMNQISYIYSGVNSGNYLYYNNTYNLNSTGIVRVNLTNPTDISYNWGGIGVPTTALATDGTYLYGINVTNSSIFKINLTNTADKTKTFTPANTIGSINTQIGGGMYYYSNTLYVSDYVNRKILSINTGNAYTTTFLNLTLSPYSGIQSSVLGALFIYSGNLYVNTNNIGTNQDGIMARFSMTNLTNFTYPFKIQNINMGINWVDNGFSETYALNSTTGDLYGYTLDRSWIYKVNLNTYDACMNWYAGSPDGRTGYALTLTDSYLYNLTQSGSGPFLYKISTIVPTAPNATIIYDKGNTYTVGLGNLQVSFTDASNSTNNVYYQYSIRGFNGNVFANASVFSIGTNAFRYYITGLSALTDISYSLNMTVINSIGNSTIQSTSVIIYTTPTAITNSTISTGSIGNINVSVTETMPSTYYYLNNVSYWYYLYTTGTNQSSNIAAYSQGTTMNASYTTNFVIQNLPPNNYRVYLLAKNTVGNSAPVLSTSANVTVLGIPSSPNSYSLSFDPTTGITVSVTDNRNVALNQVYYYYYYYQVGGSATNQSDNIAVYSNSYVPVVNGQTSYSFTINGLQTSYYNVYIATKNSVGGNIYSPVIAPVNVICFKEDSRILTNRGYRKIQYLKRGDLIKTFKDGFKPIYKIGKKEIMHVPSLEKRTKEQLYKCSPTEYPEVFEELVLTGCHSILVDEFADDKQRKQTQNINGGIYVTDTKYRLPVCVDHRASVYEHAGKYAVYHIALENDDKYMNYGIYANGLLVESTSKRFLDEYKVMDTQ